MAQAQLQEQQNRLRANAEESSFVALSQEGEKNRLVSGVKAEFVNVLKVRKLVRRRLE